ncbi:hypothetical protein Trydic_g10388 [Trypoxylus dichotomus]
MKEPNLHLFGNPNTSELFTRCKILSKYAHACGSKNPSSITCTRLRKHIATLTNDLEQLASFMGYTLSVHRSSYRLPDDIYKTAKISKLLLLMGKGEAGQFKGKKLDEINFDLKEDLLQTGINEDTKERLKQTSEHESIIEEVTGSEEEK